MVTSKNNSGLLLATAAAALFMSGTVVAGESSPQEAKVHCSGINACKGQTECKTATNACKGQNDCKGKGFLSTTADECAERGGTVSES